MQAVNNSILLRMNSLPDLKVGKEKGKGEIQINVEEKPDDVEKADLLSTVAKLQINRTSSVRNQRTKHVASFFNFTPQTQVLVKHQFRCTGEEDPAFQRNWNVHASFLP